MTRRLEPVLKYCIVCAKPFQTFRSDAKTDSHKCRQRLSKWRADNRKATKVEEEINYLTRRGIALPLLLDLSPNPKSEKECKRGHGAIRPGNPTQDTE